MKSAKSGLHKVSRPVVLVAVLRQKREQEGEQSCCLHDQAKREKDQVPTGPSRASPNDLETSHMALPPKSPLLSP